MPDRHARLSASASSRWIHCPGSIALSDKFRDDEASGGPFAAEGTLAHSLAESELRWFNNELTDAGYKIRLSDLTKNDLYTKSMFDSVIDYTGYVIDQFNKIAQESGEAHLAVEVEVDLSRWAPESFGTSDAVIYSPDRLAVCDLKFGKGIEVSAINNPQIRLYALGAIAALGHVFDPDDEISMHIIQPRLDRYTSETMTYKELLEWAETIKIQAAKAWAGNPEYQAGEWCQFCPARALCKERAKHSTAVLNLPSDPALMTAKEVAQAWPLVEQVRRWATHLTDYATRAAESGTKFPGLKLIEGRSNRKITNEQGLIDSLAFEYGDDVIEKLYRDPQLKSLTDLEAQFGKKALRESAGRFIEKPPGKATLVSESDPRKEKVSLVDMFDKM